MGEGSPTRFGTGDAPGGLTGVKRCSSVYRVTERAVVVKERKSAVSGFGRTDNVPVNIAPTYVMSPPGIERGM
jgi:hypothetical protein